MWALLKMVSELWVFEMWLDLEFVTAKCLFVGKEIKYTTVHALKLIVHNVCLQLGSTTHFASLRNV
jgi:hypothetical protein